jgi:hypothetical protein
VRSICEGAAPIVRPMPVFPSTFYSGIDVSITNKGFTYTVYESYDAGCQAVVQEIFLPTLGHTRYLYDYRSQRRWTIRSASKNSPGSCMSQDLDPNNPFVHEDGVQLASAQRFLSFHKDAVYVPRAQLNNPQVRCVLCLKHSLLCSESPHRLCWSAFYESPVTGSTHCVCVSFRSIIRPMGWI